MDLWPFDVRRFGPPSRVSAATSHERAVEAYGRYYTMHWPAEEATLGARRAGAAPLHADPAASAARCIGSQVRLGAAELVRPAGTTPSTAPSFERRPNWFDAVGAEHRAVRERVALIDMTLVLQVRNRGPGALAALQRIAANDLDRPAGTIVYTQLCNERGGIEAD